MFILLFARVMSHARVLAPASDECRDSESKTSGVGKESCAGACTCI